MPKVSVVILNFKVKTYALKCIDSVKQSTISNLQIILVDNNSQDGIVDEVVKIKDCIFIQNNKNLGYAGGNNVGIKKALELGADFVLILNPDTVIDKNAIKYLIEGVNQYQAFLANPKIYFGDKETIWFAGKKFDYNNVLASHIGVNEKDKGQFDKDEELEDATGAALFIKSDVFKKIGYFDERFFLYFEESDFCFRARKHGFKIMYLPKAKVYHDNAKSTGLGSSLQDYFITRNRMLFAKKHLSFRVQFALFREALRNLKNPTRRLALFDFLINNFGKGSFKI